MEMDTSVPYLPTRAAVLASMEWQHAKRAVIPWLRIQAELQLKLRQSQFRREVNSLEVLESEAAWCAKVIALPHPIASRSQRRSSHVKHASSDLGLAVIEAHCIVVA
jgi:hypothetical protein